MDFAFEEQTSAQAYDVWRAYGAEPLDDDRDDEIWPVRTAPAPQVPPATDPAPKNPFVRALLTIATAPLPSVALASLAMSLLRRRPALG